MHDEKRPNEYMPVNGDAQKENRRLQDRYLDSVLEQIDRRFNEAREDRKDLFDKIDEIKAENAESKSEIKGDIRELKVRSGLWGAASGLIATATVLLGAWFKGHLKP